MEDSRGAAARRGPDGRFLLNTTLDGAPITAKDHAHDEQTQPGRTSPANLTPARTRAAHSPPGWAEVGLPRQRNDSHSFFFASPGSPCQQGRRPGRAQAARAIQKAPGTAMMSRAHDRAAGRAGLTTSAIPGTRRLDQPTTARLASVARARAPLRSRRAAGKSAVSGFIARWAALGRHPLLRQRKDEGSPPWRSPASRPTDDKGGVAPLQATRSCRRGSSWPGADAAAPRGHPTRSPRLDPSFYSPSVSPRSARSWSMSSRSWARPACRFRRSRSEKPMKVAGTPAATSIRTAAR